ncbi:MAG: xanthine phosphoribosyltransferase [Anaerolineaceae bacterium]|nr:xanthine phosphoribosyltransferase [Anaerolineaceae bacterium]MCY3907350.1 xanthine phosphoribosyltransferase [Anaerolineaceae bacterium]
MQQLAQAIQGGGLNLGHGILKVDHILNHQIDPGLMRAIGQEMARRFRSASVDRILTCEVSGIAPALATGLSLNVPVVYARKHKPITMSGPVYLETAPSHTRGGEVTLMVAAEFLHAGEQVLVIDDFLASGLTTLAMLRMVVSAQATVAGVGVVIEKSFEQGRACLSSSGFGDVPVEALAVVTSMQDGRIVLAP